MLEAALDSEGLYSEGNPQPQVLGACARLHGGKVLQRDLYCCGRLGQGDPRVRVRLCPRSRFSGVGFRVWNLGFRV